MGGTRSAFGCVGLTPSARVASAPFGLLLRLARRRLDANRPLVERLRGRSKHRLFKRDRRASADHIRSLKWIDGLDAAVHLPVVQVFRQKLISSNTFRGRQHH